MEEEKALALQAFDLILRTWNPVDEVVAAERALFCIKVVLMLCPPVSSEPPGPPQTRFRMHALNALYNMTVPQDSFYPAHNPRIFMTLMHGLFMLLPAVQRCEALQTQGLHESLYMPPESQIPEEKKLIEIIEQVKTGSCGKLDRLSVEEEYSTLCLAKDSDRTLRDAIALEAWAKCVEFGSNELKRALIRHGVENYWTRTERHEYSPLTVTIKCRVLGSLTRAIISLLFTTNPLILSSSSSGPPIDLLVDDQARELREVDGTLVIWTLQTRVLPELDDLQETASGGTVIEAIRKDIVKVVLELLMSRTTSDRSLGGEEGRFSTGDGIGQLVSWSISMIGGWCRENNRLHWKTTFQQVLRAVEDQWRKILRITRAIIEVLPDEIRKLVLTIMLPVFQDRLVNSPLPLLSSDKSESSMVTNILGKELTSLIDAISRMHPQIFYKPLFTLAASSKEFAVANHLCSIVALARWLPDFWVRDAEMIAVAVMSEVSGGAKSRMQSASALDPTRQEYGVASLGQSVILVEVIGQFQKARKARDVPSHSTSSMPDNEIVEIAKFAFALEARLALLIEAKEKTTLVPFSQRLLFMMLFREIRLLTKSLKSIKWLPRLISWFVNYHDRRDELEDEMSNEIALIQEVYDIVKEVGRPPNQKHRSTMILSPPLERTPNTPAPVEQGTGISSAFDEKSDLLKGIGKGFAKRALKLMVALSTMITVEDSARIGTLLWEHHIEENDPSVLSSACFLMNICAEKTSLDLLANIEVDLQSLHENKRLQAIKKFSTLISWRFQILTQPLVTDRAHRPFKMPRTPLQFVATDIGSSLFVLEIDPNEVKDKQIPLELRKQLAEIGWESDDSPVNQQLEWIRTPMSNLPPLQIDKVEGNIAADNPLTPSLSPRSSPRSPELEKIEEISLLRRNSSSGGPLAGLKRRAIFVPTLGHLLPRIAAMMFDSSVAVACTARNLLVDLMRNDPGLLTRPVWDLFSGDEHDFTEAITTLSAFLHVRHVLPPAMAHTMFNHLAGLLKYASKQIDTEESLRKYAHAVPLLGKLANQVSNMSIREMRRAKLEILFVPSGSLWFPSSAPIGPMFPRGPGFDNPFEHEVSPRLVSITMIRISQNMLFLAMLKRNPAEVQVLRKNMVRLVLPSMDAGVEAPPLELKDFAPLNLSVVSDQSDLVRAKIRGLSQILSCTYLLLVAQVFRCMSRHLNDRNELAVLVDGINRILLEHGSDIGIVSHALIALMVASTRFKRLFASGGGYLLFMPAILKVYVEGETHHGIRHAIEYAVNRFYAHHEETFVFQSLSAVSQMFILPGIDGEWIGKHVYSLFASLHRSVPSSALDEAGIHGANKSQEREALIINTAEEKPQTFFAALRAKEGQNEKVLLSSEFPQEFEVKRLDADDLVRLFLTVVAHDLSVARAEQFLRTLRFLAPHFYEANLSARNVLQEGIEALGVILFRTLKPKTFDPTASQVNESVGGQTVGPNYNYEQLAEKTREPSDTTSMRIDYFQLVVTFTRAGGKLTNSSTRMTFEAVKSILREAPVTANISVLLGDYIRTSLIAPKGRKLKAVVHFLTDLVPIISTYAATLDLSAVFVPIAELTEDSTYASDPTFCQLVVEQICEAGLTACEQVSADKQLQSVPWRPAFIRLIACTLSLANADIIGQLGKHKPTYEMLMYIVLPLSLSMKSKADLDMSGTRIDPMFRNTQMRAWMRLFSFTVGCCEKSQTSDVGPLGPRLARSRSRDSRTSDGSQKTQLPLLLMALQVIKVLIVRGGRDLNTCLPEVWTRLSILLRSLLAEGDAEFALKKEASPTPSPIPSRRASGQLDFNRSTDIFATRPLSLGETSYRSPRFVDYCLWSMGELICVYQTPLFLQMRSFMHEKIHALEMEARQEGKFHSGQQRPSSVFSKPRMRHSNPSSPDTSPLLCAVNTSASADISFNSLRPDSLGIGYRPTPPALISSSSARGSPVISSNQGRSSTGPRIVHLGLVSPSQHRSISPGGGRGQIMMRVAMGDSTRVRSLTLIKQTYARLRVVQSRLGYQPLSWDSGLDSSSRGTTELWTKAKALKEIVKETQELMEEFEEGASGINTIDSDGEFVNGYDFLEYSSTT
ncbi:hypothetical protein E1B28_006112 [Marasmius oreades]|uniref:Uncharacterized protein n=1 Tax=Marasmius oreades TaxID=181124 RepID=A0A9P7S798_9AGAR|nr:uncharacterized protein E1B28_006112 [Marasmius oreades]KAG7095353.1 hypothetical protein E1B28_006112 [Marasmius oreades]